MDIERYKESIFNLRSPEEFNGLALDLFQYQYKYNTIYKRFTDLIGIDPSRVDSIEKIPFLPIRFFKDHHITTGSGAGGGAVFRSSSTGNEGRSSHFVPDIRLYQDSFRKGFMHFYGPPEQYRFLALLPSYLEQGESSLVYMMNDFIKRTDHSGSGFFLKDLSAIVKELAKPAGKDVHTVLFGVSYALLDLAEMNPAINCPLMVMETGGMKGRRKEMVKGELHHILKKSFGVEAIHSEYGMTELLSQAYSRGEGIFETPPWMKVVIREMNDPLSPAVPGRTGGINIIDLANIHSCGFIATQDLGKVYPDDTFEVLGRFDASDIRGCNLMYVS